MEKFYFEKRRLACSYDYYYFYIFTSNFARVGEIQIDTNRNPGKITIGVSIKKEFRSKGIATAAIKKVIELYPSHTICLDTKKENIACQNVAEKCGFKFIGTGENYFGDRSLLYETENISGSAANNDTIKSVRNCIRRII